MTARARPLPVKLEVHADADAVARAAATIIAVEARVAVAARGRFVMAVSGGRTSWLTLRALKDEDVPWKSVHLAQVDEYVVAPGHPARNLGHMHTHVLQHGPMPPGQIAAMPVEAPDLAAGASRYARLLRDLAGSPPVFDLVQLVLGADGHTAALLPDDPVLEVTDRDVAVTEPYQGLRRMTLTYPILDRSRSVLWLVTGSGMTPMLTSLRQGDRSIPAARVRSDHALVVADHLAAGEAGLRY